MDTHINVPKHLWGRVMKNVNPTQIQSIIYQAIRKGTWALQSNGSIKITYRYNGQIVVVTGNNVKNVFKVGNAWVWNGYGKP